MSALFLCRLFKFIPTSTFMSIFDKVKSVFSSYSGDKTNDNSKEQENLTSVQIFANMLDFFH